MPANTDYVKMGVCYPIFGGVNLGLTKGGVEVEVSTSTHEVVVDQYGETPINEIIMGRTVTATVPLAETSLENLAQIMPGSVFLTDGVKATATVTFKTAVPVAGDTITVAGTTYTFVAKPSASGEVAIGANVNATAVNFADAISISNTGYIATAAVGVATVTAKATGAAWNGAITANFSTAANVTVTSLIGGANATYARIEVSTGTNTSLLTHAKTLVLRPIGTFGEDDFIIHSAATAGALSFSYSVDNERLYQVEFKGYASGNGKLFQIGK